jgi:hypothetical protein
LTKLATICTFIPPAQQCRGHLCRIWTHQQGR